jgi:hypothetical protein
VPLLATLRFDPADPMAVTLAMWVGEDQLVEWTFARQLLADDAHQPTGAGDVRVYPASGGGRRVFGLCLSNPDGHAEFELPVSRVGAFVRDTYAAVPAEWEGDLIDWEAELGSLFRLARRAGCARAAMCVRIHESLTGFTHVGLEEKDEQVGLTFGLVAGNRWYQLYRGFVQGLARGDSGVVGM